MVDEYKEFHETAERCMQELIKTLNAEHANPLVAASALSNILAIVCVKELGLTYEDFDNKFKEFWERAEAQFNNQGSGVNQ